MQEIKLTQKQQEWLQHAQQADLQGISMVEYAKRHHLNLKLFYHNSSVLRKKGALPETGNNKKLVPVSLSPIQSDTPQIPCRISLPNGVVIELPSTELASILTYASRL
jgi:hypothetical protein